MSDRFRDFFGKEKIIIGMLHLAGGSIGEKRNRVGRELDIYSDEGLNGAIIEDYHASLGDLEEVLWVYGKPERKGVLIGTNTLKDPFRSFRYGVNYSLGFLQLDTVNFLEKHNTEYNRLRNSSNACVLGGVRFKHQPETGRSLEEDIKEGMSRCDAIVTTGSGTGKETPLKKLEDFRRIMGDFPLIVGSGVSATNVKEQLKIADGAIVGSYFKAGDTMNNVDIDLVKRLMDDARPI